MQCPVCRCVVQPGDIAHVASYTNSDPSAYKVFTQPIEPSVQSVYNVVAACYSLKGEV